MTIFDRQREQLIRNLDVAHAAYYRAEVFGGPSLHFHLQALRAATDGDFDRFVEIVYALLASWGMHRMGRGGSKMRDYEDFYDSLRPLWPAVLSLQQAAPESLDKNAWKDLRKVFSGIRCMATGTSLVGNSKVMAHALPNLITPVDREYTLNYLYGSTNITNGIDVEWKKLKTIHRDFFYPLEQSKDFRKKADRWTQRKEEFRWDTSKLKILDNLLIGVVKNTRAANGTSPDARKRRDRRK